MVCLKPSIHLIYMLPLSSSWRWDNLPPMTVPGRRWEPADRSDISRSQPPRNPTVAALTRTEQSRNIHRPAPSRCWHFTLPFTIRCRQVHHSTYRALKQQNVDDGAAPVEEGVDDPHQPRDAGHSEQANGLVSRNGVMIFGDSLISSVAPSILCDIGLRGGWIRGVDGVCDRRSWLRNPKPCPRPPSIAHASCK